MRVFICSSGKYPRETASANRIHIFAKMCEEKNLEVLITSCGKNDEISYDVSKDCYVYDGIMYKNIKTAKNKNIFEFIFRGKRTCDILNDYDFSKDDIVIVDTSIPMYSLPILRFVHQRGGRVIFDRTEWYQPFQYKFGKFDPNFLLNDFHFHHIIPKGDGVIVISKFLYQHFKGKVNNIFYLPFVTDALVKRSNQIQNDKDKIRFIYPGNPGKKDNFAALLKGFESLTQEEQNRIEFHITLISPNQLKNILGKDAYLLESLKDRVVFHGRLEYDELIKLYNTVDFLLVVKSDNIVSKSNFPSKVPELMAYGVIPILTKIGDIADYLEDSKNCIFIEDDQPDLIADAINQAINLSNEKKEQMQSNTKNVIETTLNYKNWSESFVNFLREENNEY